MGNHIDYKNNYFVIDDQICSNPTVSSCGRFTVSPEEYGFKVWATGGGCSAWVLELENGSIVLTNNHLSHDLGEDLSSFEMGFYKDNLFEDQAINIINLKVGLLPFTDEEIDDLADNAINAMAKHIQEYLGVETGDIASQYLTDDVLQLIVKKYIKAELRDKE